MLLMVEKGIPGGICQAIYRYGKAKNIYMKNYDKSIISSYLMYLDENNWYGLAMSQKLPVNGFKWVKSVSKFEDSNKRYFLKIDVEYRKTSQWFYIFT